MSQSRSRSTLQASQKRLQSCTAQRKRPASAARAVSPLSHAFLLLVHVVYVPVPFAGGRCGGRARYRKYLACAALRYQYIIRGGVPAMAQTVGTLGLGNARRYSTKLPVCPVLIYCCSCCSLLALFFLFSSLLFLIPALSPCFLCLSEHWLVVSSLRIFSSLQKHPEYRAARLVLSLTCNLHLQHQVNSLNSLS